MKKFKQQHISRSLYTYGAICLLATITLLSVGQFSQKAYAASQNFVVNSIADGHDADTNDGICQTTTTGECTLRAAIEQANNNNNASDTDTISFAISGTGVHTITLASPYYISQPLVIDGYSQNGASANTAAWPAALDGTLTIELDASAISTGGGVLTLESTATNSTIKGLVVNHVFETAVYVDAGNSGSHIEGNYLNTDVAGLITQWQTTQQNAIYNNGDHLSVGGASAAQRNVISSKKVAINVPSAVGNNVTQGNNFFVGSDSVTALSSDASAGLGVSGIAITNNDTFGGSGSGEGNTVENFLGSGALYVSGSNVNIKGNRIMGNAGAIGVAASASQVTIGGTTTNERNIISGNLTNDNGGGVGIFINEGADTVSIIGNYIGVLDDGVTILGNSSGGIISAGDNVTIGGANSNQRNVISGNGTNGINKYGTSSAVIQGNYIGVGADGITAAGNQGNGIDWSGTGGTIGGASTGEGNVVANSGLNGIEVASNSAVSIKGNYIGVGSDGTTAAGNQGNGIRWTTTAGQIGGSTTTERNIIANSGSHGIAVSDSTGLAVINNYIGVGSDGTTAAGNQGNGIDWYNSNGSNGDIIGGSASSASNTIAHNTGSGVKLSGNDGSYVSILHNKITSNDGLGIDIGNYGVEQNDDLDADSGFNDLLNYPVTYQTIESGGNTTISYRIDVPAGDYRVEYYSNVTPDPSGNGEGQEFVGSQNITSNGSGSQEFSFVATGTDLTNLSGTATLIDGGSSTGFGPTSEFGTKFVPPIPVSDLSATTTIVDPDSIVDSDSIEYNVVIKNNGPDAFDISSLDASGGNPFNTALFNDIAPPELTFTGVTGDVSCASPAAATGYGSLFTDHDDFNVITCGYNGSSPRTLEQDETINFTMSFDRNSTNPTNSEFTNYVLSVPTEFDDDTTAYDNAVSSGNDILSELGTTINNLNSVATEKPEADIEITNVLTNPQDMAPGATLNYSVQYKNNGPAKKALSENATLFLSQPLFYYLTPPDLQVEYGADAAYPGTYYIESNNPDLTCVGGGPGSYGAVFESPVNPDYGIVACWYAGSDAFLSSGGSFNADFSYTLNGSTQLASNTYAYASLPDVYSSDPDQQNIINAFTDNGSDIVASAKAGVANNFAIARPSTDIGVSASMVNTGDISPSDVVSYDITYTNRGPAGLDLSSFSTSEDAILNGLFPGLDLAYTSSSSGLSCTDFGPGSYIYLGPAGQDHTNHQIISCEYTGSGEIIAPGQTKTFRLNFTAKNGIHATFASSFIQIQEGDPDAAAFFNDFYGADHDVLDTFTNDNSARVVYQKSTGPDADNDGIPDSVENAAPNSGDANNDGTQDSTQANVASYINTVTNKYVTLAVSSQCSIQSSSVQPESANSTLDSSYDYPLGLMNFSLGCGTPGFTTPVSQYYFNQNNNNYVTRKYLPSPKTYSTIDGASVTNQTIGGTPAVVASYQLQDGGPLDTDGQSNGTIVDPSGLATRTDSSNLPNTGENLWLFVVAGAVLVAAGSGALYIGRLNSSHYR